MCYCLCDLVSCRAFRVLYDYQAKDNSGVAFVYCDHASRDQQTAQNILASFLSQLIIHFPSDNPIVKDLLECEANDELPDLLTIRSFLQRIAESHRFNCIRFGADGLDELIPANQAEFLDSLGPLCKLSSVSCLLFGRKNAGVQEQVESSFDTVPRLHFIITGDMTKADLGLFVRQQVGKHKTARNFDNNTRDIIFDNLVHSKLTYVPHWMTMDCSHGL
jgi:hypothetical protein